MSKLLKRKISDELRQRYSGMRDCVLLKFEGLDVQNADALRAHLRRSGISINVVNNRLTSMVLKEMEFAVEDDLFKGPTAIAWGGEDAISAPKVITEWIRASKTKAVRIKGGFLDRSAVDAKGVRDLANIPPRPVLLGLLLGTIISPMTRFLGMLTSHQSRFVGLLNALIEKREKEEPAGETAAERPDESGEEAAAEAAGGSKEEEKTEPKEEPSEKIEEEPSGQS
ncbi:MAG: 50S ribosomal protein L10 [Planctomycetota bacterium]|nr:MAG: 50S ribosomal protein L10 [Planctomycetota bacterium]